MALIKFRNINFSLERQERILQINSILSQYQQRVSVRQLYYRLVAGGIIPNVDKEYDKVQNLITDARYAGLIDWDAIEDRNRAAQRVEDWPSGSKALNEVAEKFRKDRWITQPFYVELWVEKAALAGVLAPIAQDYHITLMVNRGYSSASAMMESAQRLIHRGDAKRPVILYLGDFDPSGEDMVRDIQARLMEFGVPGWTSVRKVALTWDQIGEYKPPPNPVKRNDSRSSDFIAKHGGSSWEVDALPPKDLDLIVRTTINAYVDKAAMTKSIEEENIIKAKIKKFASTFTDPS